MAKITLRVADVGVGVGPAKGGNRLGNLRSRAEQQGGAFTVADVHPHGVMLTGTFRCEPSRHAGGAAA